MFDQSSVEQVQQGTGTIAVDLDKLISEEQVLAARLDSDDVADGMLPDEMQEMQEQLRICRKYCHGLCYSTGSSAIQ